MPIKKILCVLWLLVLWLHVTALNGSILIISDNDNSLLLSSLQTFRIFLFMFRSFSLEKKHDNYWTTKTELENLMSVVSGRPVGEICIQHH